MNKNKKILMRQLAVECVLILLILPLYFFDKFLLMTFTSTQLTALRRMTINVAKLLT